MWGESEDKVLLILSDVDKSLHGLVLSPAPQGATGLSPKPVSQGSSSSFSPDSFSLPPSLPSPSFLSFALVRREHVSMLALDALWDAPIGVC